MSNNHKYTPILFEAVREQYYKTQVSNDILIYAVEIAGQCIRIEFANDILLSSILPALSHLLIENINNPHLTIRIWDTTSTGIPLPNMPWQHKDFSSRREIRGANGDGYMVAYDLYCGIFSIISLKHREAYWWIHDCNQLPDYERAAPLREILQAWFSQFGGIFLHGAAIGNDMGGVLLIGRGGVGKSTTALGSISPELRLIGEDYCLLTHLNGIPLIHSLYSSGKLDNKSLDLLPYYKDFLINPHRSPDEKAIFMLYPNIPTQQKTEIKTLLLPNISNTCDVHLTLAKSSQVFLALAPSTILQLSGTGQSALKMMKELVQKLPAYILHLNQDFDQVSSVLLKLIEGKIP